MLSNVDNALRASIDQRGTYLWEYRDSLSGLDQLLDRPRRRRRGGDSGESHLKIHYLVLFNGVYGFISNIMCGVYECV